MGDSDRPLRADAERNRRALLDAAAEMFRERGLDVGVGEIAQRAGVGRGTVFRRFPTKADLIAAIVADRMSWAAGRGHELLEQSDTGEELFEFIRELAGAQQLDRALFDGLGEEWLMREEIREAHDRFALALEALLTRAQAAGTVRPDVGVLDVMMLFKGLCQAAQSLPKDDPVAFERLSDLFFASLLPTVRPLRGRTPTLADLALPPAQPAAKSA
jgi:AcrR family transcriptional regulator